MTKKSNVLKLFDDPVATCPRCSSQTWFIKVDDYDKSFTRITSFECSNEDCNFAVDINIIDFSIEGSNGNAND